MGNEEKPKIQVAKHFAVSVDELYGAWTEEAQLKQWWKPMGKEITAVENDIRPGGNVVYHFGDDLRVHGEYREAEPKKRLVYSWIWELPEDSLHRGSYLLTVQFLEEEQGSKLEVTQENFASEQAIKPHETGWEEALSSLEHYLEGSKK